MEGEGDRIARRLFGLSLGVFFIGGFVASSIGLLVPQVRLALGLDYAAATQIQLASYSSYLVFAPPIAAMLGVLGFMRGHAAGLALMAAGCVALATGAALQAFAVILVALLILSAGQTVLQIASNTVVTLASDPRRAAVRLNLLQGFNALGTVLGPLLAAGLIGASGIASAGVPFALAALVLIALSAVFLRHRALLPTSYDGRTRISRAAWAGALGHRRLRTGSIAIFAYVGAEVTIGALLTDFLMTRHATALPPADAARWVAVYWGSAMAGRFAGAWLMRRAPAPTLLAAAALLALALVALAIAVTGPIAAAALVGVGLFHSIMYPTIYVLALPPRPEQATAGATILCMAVVGGAVVPHLTGLLADRIGLVPALLLPACCYLPVFLFARSCRTP